MCSSGGVIRLKPTVNSKKIGNVDRLNPNPKIKRKARNGAEKWKAPMTMTMIMTLSVVQKIRE